MEKEDNKKKSLIKLIVAWLSENENSSEMYEQSKKKMTENEAKKKKIEICKQHKWNHLSVEFVLLK